jgi:hypothetical protein
MPRRGHLSLISKHGHPLFVAVPLDEHLLGSGVTVTLACRLFAEKTLSLGKAAGEFRMMSAELPDWRFRRVPSGKNDPRLAVAWYSVASLSLTVILAALFNEILNKWPLSRFPLSVRHC